MNDYQNEQRDALVQIKTVLQRMPLADRSALQVMIEPYLLFRKQMDAFAAEHFSAFCTSSCFTSQVSACCSKDGIITFWADAVINVCCSENHQVDRLLQVLSKPFAEHKCIYLGPNGCCWQVRPLGCALFLCDPVQEKVFAAEGSLKNQWDQFQCRAKGFRWPDRPVLFDRLEEIFMEAGCKSPLMYLHNSPGLMRIKKLAGISG